MCNRVRKCVSFFGSPQFVVIFPVKRFAGDCWAKSPLPSHKKTPVRNSTTSSRAALPFDFTRSGPLGSVSLSPRGAKSRVFPVRSTPLVVLERTALAWFHYGRKRHLAPRRFWVKEGVGYFPFADHPGVSSKGPETPRK